MEKIIEVSKQRESNREIENERALIAKIRYVL